MLLYQVSIVVVALLSYAFATGAGGRREFGHNSLSRHAGGTGTRYGNGRVSNGGARGEQGAAVENAYDVGVYGFGGNRNAGARREHVRTVKGGYVTVPTRAGTDKGGYVTVPTRAGTDKGGYVTVPTRAGTDKGGHVTVPTRAGTDKGGYVTVPTRAGTVKGGDRRENGAVKGGYVVDGARRELVETDRGGYEFGNDRRKNGKAIKDKHGDDGARRKHVKDGYGDDGQSFPPRPYQFDYEASDGQGNRHYRSERRDESGVVRGTYGYTDNQGLYRNVEYVADAGGYRANIRTNEPGTDGKENPAGVHLVVETPPAGIQEKYDTVDGSGVARGTYGYTDNQGLHRNVEYVADTGGYRANIRTNEPGTNGKENPAGDLDF